MILTISTLFLGVFIAIQYSLIKPSRNDRESSETMAIEIEHLAKNNANLKNQLRDLTQKYQGYRDSLNNQAALEEQLTREKKELEIVNANTQIAGQGVEIIVDGKLVEAQIVDLINAIKNIGADAISISGRRFNLYSSINQNSIETPLIINIIGNSAVLESALERKGGIVEQLKSKGVEVKLAKKNDLLLDPSEQQTFKYAKIIGN